MVATSSTRTFPRAPWKRNEGTRARGDREGEGEECTGERAMSSRSPAVPGLEEFDPNVRWWSNLTGLTDSFNDSEGQSLLGPETTRTLIANLQGLSDDDRSRVTTSLLAFVGLFIAELLKIINDAETGERVVLLQSWLAPPQSDVTQLMQRNLEVGPGNFARLLVELQQDMEGMDKTRAATLAKAVGNKLNDLEGMEGDDLTARRTKDRRDRMRALLVAYEGIEQAMESAPPPDVQPTWSKLCPFIAQVDRGNGRQVERASGSGDAAGALDSEDEREGILVKRELEEEWAPATKEEAEELRRHDRQLREEEESQHGVEAFARFEAARAQEWEDWVMHTELQPSPRPPPTKRVRARVVMGTTRGDTLAEQTLEGDIAETDRVMLTFSIEESLSSGSKPGQGSLAAPSTPSTVQMTSTQIEKQLLQVKGAENEETDLDNFLHTAEGKEVYCGWLEGRVKDEEVRDKWGDHVLKVTKAIEDDSQALNTQKDCAKYQDRPLQSTAEQRGSSSEPGMEGLSQEERRTKRTREGAIASTVGYVAPFDEVNTEGEVLIGEGTDLREEGDEPELEAGMDVEEMDDIQLMQTANYVREKGSWDQGQETECQDTEVASFMQKGAAGKFEIRV